MRCYRYAQLALAASLMLAPVAMAADGGKSASQAVFVGDQTGEVAFVDESGDVAAAAVLKELDENVELAQFSSSLGGGNALPLGLASGCTGQWFVGADYLNVRATFSQATAYLLQETPPGAVTAADTSFTYVQTEFDYEPNYRVYGGYRICDCGCEIRFTYTSIDSSGSFTSPVTQGDSSVIVTAPFEVIAPGQDDFVTGGGTVSIDDYDLGVSRTIPLGSPLGACGCADPCGCWCPAWDITWTGAVRVSDVSSSLNYQSVINSTGAPLARTATSTVNFQGVGLRTGMLGRRYFGREGIASIYLKGDISLLLGDVENVAVGDAFSRHSLTSTQIVPVTELEVGGSVFLTRNASVTGGYLFAAWHDLGHRPEYDFGSGSAVQLESFDDANILGVDGWFVRAEVTY
ncbi:MAG: hypothetical protein AAGB00_09405 [Planctomycetota bacterium]